MKKCVELNIKRFDSAWIFGTIALGLLALSLISFGTLTSFAASADDTAVDLINITVPIACSIESPATDQTYSATMMNNELKSNIGSTTFNVVCNDTAGFAIYAIGYGNNTLGENTMISSAGTSHNIATGTATSGGTSNWAMKLTAVSGATAPTILNGFGNFHAVPAAWTKVAQFTQAVQSAVGSSFTSTYQVYISGTQAAGTYTGKVRYDLVHPSTSCMSYTVHFNAGAGSGTMDDQVICSGTSTPLTANTFTPPTNYRFLEWNTRPDGTGDAYDDEEPVTDLADVDGTIDLYAIWYRPPIVLYDEVASMTKGTQSRTDLQASITTSNSGVYTYNSSVFGADTDGTKSDNTKATIYYYRGILDSSYSSSTYGSSGNGALSPNYVILSTTGTKATSDTCWRIIRTTGSGGVKMIYNGKWTGSTCANAQNNAQIGASYYNSTSSTNARAIANVGYTFNSYGTSTSTTNNTAPNTLFGSDSSFSGNSNNSTIKNTVESWYNSTSNSNLSNFTNILEPNAGFCNDRLVRSSQNGTSVPSTLRPVGSTSGTGTNAYFAGNQRNLYNSTSMIPSLGCSRVGNTAPSRSTVDVYSTSTASGGNGQLSRPIALITADELSFAGAGSQTANQGSAYSGSSFVRSGNSFWTMTPSYRSTSNSRATMMIYSYSSGYLNSASMYTSYDVRPVISLKEGTTATDGSGTAADPWIVKAP